MPQASEIKIETQIDGRAEKEFDNSVFHIVIFTGGDFPSPEKSVKYFSAMKPSFIIAADSGLDALENYIEFYESRYGTNMTNSVSTNDNVNQINIKFNFMPNVILGDFDSVSDKSFRERFRNCKIKKYQTAKDYTDTEIALRYAYKYNAYVHQAKNTSHLTHSKYSKKFVTLVGGCGGRMDHALSVYDSFSDKYHADAWLCPLEMAWFLQKDFSLEITGLRHEEIVSVSRTSVSRTRGKIFSENLEWAAFRKKGMPSLSNKLKTDADENSKVVLTAREMPFLVFVPYSCGVNLFCDN